MARPRTAGRVRVQQAVDAAVRRTSRTGAAAYRAAFKAAAEAPSISELERAIDAGPANVARVLMPEGATREAGQTMLTEGVQVGSDTERRLRGAAEARARATARKPITSRAAEWVRRRGAALATEVESPARAAIRLVVAQSIGEGVHVRETARRLRAVVGLHSRQVGPLQRLRASMEKRGVPAARIEARMARATAQAVAARADLIARTETVGAVNAGRTDFYEELAREGHIEKSAMVRTWLTARDERVCPICEPLDGATAEGLDGDFPGGYHDPSDTHPDDRCTVVFEERARA